MYNNDRRNNNNAEPSEFFEKVVQVNRVSKKTKGGDKRSLSVLVVAGDKKGRVGVGLGKAADVQSAVRKATARARKHMITITLKDNRTISHDVFVKDEQLKFYLKAHQLELELLLEVQFELWLRQLVFMISFPKL